MSDRDLPPRAAIQAGDTHAVRSWLDDQVMRPEIRATCEFLVEQLDRLRDPGFDEFIALVDRWLTNYPEPHFDGDTLGCGFVTALRAARRKLEADQAARAAGGAS